MSLYVGQGTSTLLLVRDAGSYLSLLVDVNLDGANGGIDVPCMMADLLDKNALHVFVNTHPHDDHLRGITALQEMTGINKVWHSGHKPGKKHYDAYNELQKVIEDVKKAGGSEVKLNGSRDENVLGEARYYILSPAEYVVEDIEGEDADTRYNRIHEQCAVLRFGKEGTWILLPGDADRDAFEKHITDYHEERLRAALLIASHHGSRSFFRYKEEDGPYLDALNAIDPAAVVISAPKQEDSKHDHPHEDAVGFYKDKVGDNLHHTGENHHCFIFDIFDDGTNSDISSDDGELAKSYPIDNGGDDGKSKKSGYSKREQVTAIAGARYAK
ncbi:MAG: competence protein ComEC [Deltaproteobacteria bacterium]|nr:competence protein ComEC [Deltaproteobacteria bacterium]